MEGITAYLLSITAAAILCAVVKLVVGDKGPAGKIIKAVSGVFLTVTLLSAVLQIELDDFEHFFDEYSASASQNAHAGKQMADAAMADIIKQQAQAYILEEAERLELTLKAEILLDDTSPPSITGVMLQGKAAPYKKAQLTQFIAENLGISQENQQWI